MKLVPLVIVSPHFDDGVLSCTSLFLQYPGALLLTVFGAGPSAVDPVTPWDNACGFSRGDDVIGARDAEDADACEALKAHRLPLNYWDIQYRAPIYGYCGPQETDLEDAISRSFDLLLSRPSVTAGATPWAIPLGISHPDHITTSRAAFDWVKRGSRREVFVYEDLPYAALPELSTKRQEAIKRVEDCGFGLSPLPNRSLVGARKQRAVNCYRSQTSKRALGASAQLAVEAQEKIYRLISH